MEQRTPARPEFSRPVDTTRLSHDESLHEITASPAERAALAERFGLASLDSLDARVRLRRVAGGFIRLTAEFSAAVVQSCIISLEPVPSRVNETFTLLYGAVEEEGDVALDGEADIVEPLQDGTIDLGEAVAQQLSLALDPYPRAPGAAEAQEAAEPEQNLSDSPFAELARRFKGGRSGG